jgi:cytochrome c6
MIRYLIIFSSIVIFLFGCNQNPNNKKDTDTTVSLEKGKEVFKSRCVSCHGADGTLGLNGAMNLHESKLSKEEKIQVITNGRKLMLSFKGILQPSEIESAAMYIETL